MMLDRLLPTLTSAQVVLIVALASGAGCDNPEYTEVVYPEGSYDRVIVRADHGNIKLKQGNALRVERNFRAAQGTLDLSYHLEQDADGGAALVVVSQCQSLFSCSVDLFLDIPALLPVEIELAEGDVWATGLDSLSARISQGNVDADIRGPLLAKVGTGSVQANLPAATSATVAVGNGNINLYIPAGRWDLKAQTPSLERDGSITLADNALGRLELISPAGQINLHVSDSIAQSMYCLLYTSDAADDMQCVDFGGRRII